MIETDLQKYKKILRETNIDFETIELLNGTTRLIISDQYVNSISNNGVSIVFDSSSENFVEFEV